VAHPSDTASPGSSFALDRARAMHVAQVVGRIATSLALAVLLLLFARANFERWLHTGQPVGLGVTALQGLEAFLFVVRRAPRETTFRPVAWIATALATCVTLFARPIADPHGGPFAILEIVQLVGLAIAVGSLGTLGRSFGLVAANRGIKTGGPYRLVRHPLYAGGLLAFVGYAAENPSARNIVLLAVAIGSQLVRISEEERLLTADDEYRRYREAVRFRLVPGLY
jgi:protein-S-isoprenylcysteine O-methyltransferase Ste14